MPDRLYFSCQIRRYSRETVLRQFGKMLSVFPFSKLAKRGPVVRVYAIEHSEPSVFERELPPATETPDLLNSAQEFMQPDCVTEIDTFWDLWNYDGDWKLMPVPVTLFCYGPEFGNEHGDHLRIEFGSDARFLPNAGVEGSLRMGQSNLKSLLRLVGHLERTLDLESRQVWSESGANFAEVLKQAVGAYHVN